MFPFWSGTRDRLATLAARPEARATIAALFVMLHLLAFSKAGHDRLDVTFNSRPGDAPYYSDPDASVVGGYPRQPHFWSRLIVSRWDAEAHEAFALRGLTACPDAPLPSEQETDQKYVACGLAWFPAYGEVAGTIASPFDWPVDLVLLFMAVAAAAIVNLLWTSDTMVRRLGLSDTYATLLAFNMFPAAFYLVAPYPESTTLAFALGGFVCLANNRWLLAGLLVGAATGLHPSGIAFAAGLGAAAVVTAWQRIQTGDRAWWRPIAGASLSAWGLIAMLIALQVCVGDWSAYWRARHMMGDEYDFWRLLDPAYYLRAFTAQHMDGLMLVGGIAVVAVMWREVAKRFQLAELVFLAAASGVGFALGVATVHEYWGINRFLLMCPILFPCIGLMARRYTAFFVMWLILAFAIYWHVELCSYIAHGRPDICPCLGRIEWFAPFNS